MFHHFECDKDLVALAEPQEAIPVSLNKLGPQGYDIFLG
jgi:hypothetical protein